MAKILIVDDSQTEMKRMTRLLEKMGHTVITAENGENGVKVAQAELPDAILMDVVMPGLNGFQATRQLTKDADTGHIPIIIVTSKSQETDRIWGRRQGATAYLHKPVSEEQLLATLQEVLPS
jgi:twitching motility two-component system response regulator PilH